MRRPRPAQRVKVGLRVAPGPAVEDAPARHQQEVVVALADVRRGLVDRGEHGAPGRGEALEQPDRRQRAVRVEARRWLVEEDSARVRDERDADRHAAALAAGD